MEPPIPGLPPGRHVDLPGRGRTWVRELPGPSAGAPTLLLLHGWTATADLNWATSYRSLQARYHVLAIDHRGHGRGLRTLRGFRLEDCADDAAALCAELGVTSVVPVGYSMGGPIAQLVWKRHPELVRGLVLCATGRRFGSDAQRAKVVAAGLVGVSMAARAASPVLRQRLVERYVSGKIGTDPRLAWAADQVRSHDYAAVIQAGAALAGFDAREWIGSVDVPTAVVVTTQDQVVDPRRQRNLAAAIPGAVVEEVASGHAAVLEAPQRFVPALLRAAHHASTATFSRR